MSPYGRDPFGNHDLDSALKATRRGFGLFGLIFLLQWLAGLAFTGLVVYVAWHFITKYW